MPHYHRFDDYFTSNRWLWTFRQYILFFTTMYKMHRGNFNEIKRESYIPNKIPKRCPQ